MVEVPEKVSKRLTVAAFIVAAIVAIFGTWSVVALTHYESRETVEFVSYDTGLTFVFHLRSDGPFSTYKDITIKSAQVLASPPQDIHRVVVRLCCGEALWNASFTKTVNYPAYESNGFEFWTAEEAEGRLIFTEDGEQQIAANLWTDAFGYEWMRPSGQSNGTVTILPKETDLVWAGTRYAAIGIILGVALAAGPEAVKDLRDIRYGLH
jgi:hypothetical protein